MQTINLDLSIKSVLPLLHAKQGDVGRKFKAAITDGGTAYPISSDMQLSVWYSGTSGEGNYSAIDGRNAFSVSGNAVTVELITQMLQNKGRGTLCLVINAADGSQIGLWNIPYIVEPVPGMGSTAAEQHYTALSEVAANAAAAADRAEQAADKLTTDTTFTKSGVAADAAAVGKALAQKADSGIVSGTEIVDSLDALTELVKSSVLSMGEHSVKFVSVQLDTDESCGGGELRIFKGVDGNATQRGSAMLTTTDGLTLLLTGFNEGGSDNSVWSWDTEWKYVYRDTGWVDLELSDSFALYNGQAYNQPRYRVCGNTVSIRGSVTPTEALTSSSSDIVIATGIPEEYRPKVSEYFVCQGSVMNRWLCTVKSTGEITISKYGTTEYTEIPAGAWLAFCVTYQLGGF